MSAEQCTCPVCGALFGWQIALASDTARQVLHAIGRMPTRVAAWMPLYLEMFRNRETTALPWAQLRTLVDQLEPMLVAERVDLLTAGGMISRRAPAAVWARALEVTVGKRNKPDFSLPLLTNMFLLRTVYSFAEHHQSVSTNPLPSSAGARIDPADTISAAVFAGHTSREDAATQLQRLGLSAQQIHILIGAPLS